MTPDTAALRARPVTILPDRIVITAAERDALCDAADEVERLRKAVWASEEIDRRAGMLAGVQAERDASRTAHAALDAELRAKVAEARTWRGYKTRDIGDAFDATTVTDLLDDLTALLDRHAPEEGR